VTAWLRRAGRGLDPDGAVVTWSVAEGRRGRRWREVRCTVDGAILSSLLYETDPERRFSHTELATPAGLLTLHPETDGTIHGNTITPGGVHPVAADWDPGWGIAFEGDSFASAIGAWAGVGLIVARDLSWGWGKVDAPVLELDERGVPRLAEAEEWPLE
jgi:hypothetical protein